MADWSKPELESTYANLVDEINARDTDLAAQFNPTYAASQSNLVAGTVQWLGSANKWRIWNGSVWNDLSSLYAINISGNAATASALSSAPGSVLEVGRYFDFHSAANGYDYDVRLDAQAGVSAGDGTLVITASNVAATLFTGALAGNATTATNAGGSSFATKATAAEGQLIAQKSGQNPAYLYNNDSAWGLYSASGGVMASFDRATGKFNFYGNAATATSAANGGVTSVNGQTGAVVVSTAWGAITGKPTGPNIAGNWYWSGQAGQPTWLWGGGDGTNFYVYNPSNFSVNYANSAGSADSAGYANSAGTLGAITHGAVGSLCFASAIASASAIYVSPGGTLAGSSLLAAFVKTNSSNTTVVDYYRYASLPGTWRCLGYLYLSASPVETGATLWQRIS